jgi:hypothetical protein
MLASFHEEIVSSASFLSKTSSKFEVDEYEEEKGDRHIKSKFDSSSSDSENDEDGDEE